MCIESIYSIPEWMKQCFLFLQKWNGPFHSCRNEQHPFHSHWNEMVHSNPAGMKWSIPFLQEWTTSIPFPLECNGSFHSKWNDHSIPAGMECHSTHAHKKYAARKREEQIMPWPLGCTGAFTLLGPIIIDCIPNYSLRHFSSVWSNSLLPYNHH